MSAKMTKFFRGGENCVRRKILSDENFVRRKFCLKNKILFWLVLIVLISYKYGTYMYGCLATLSLRGGQMETVKREQKCKFNTLFFSLLKNKVYGLRKGFSIFS